MTNRLTEIVSILWSATVTLLASSVSSIVLAASPVSATQYCPAYIDSPIYRQRQNQIQVGPTDDWQSIIAGADANTEILMADGDYRLTRYAVYIQQPNITIRGASGNRGSVRIVGQGYSPGSEGLMLAGPDITIADLTMSNIRDHAISIKSASGAMRAHIYNVHLFDIGTQHIKGASGSPNQEGVVACSSIGYTPGGAKGDYLGAIDIHNAVDWIVRDNYIYNINGDGSGCNVDVSCGTYIYGAPAIYLWQNASGTIVERNTIVDSYRGIALGLGTGHDGGVIRNNFIYRPVAGDAGIELWTSTNLLVEHNTVILGGDYPGAIEYRNTSNITIRNNLVSATPYDRGGNNGISVQGNISDASVNDLAGPSDPHLNEGSRAIGAGVESSLLTDIDGDTRSGRWDVGADQYSSGNGNCNLLVNGDFESVPEQWYTNTTPVITANAASGQQALQVSGGSLSQQIPTRPGVRYVLTGRYQSSVASEWSGFGIDYLNVSQQEVGEKWVTFAPAAGYSDLGLTGTVPAGTVSMRVWVYTPSTRTTLLDSLVLHDRSCVD